MTESNTTPAPPPSDPAPVVQAPASRSVADPTYNAEELAAEASSFDCHSWDVRGIFFTKGVERMTEAEFRTALDEWRTPASLEINPARGSH